MTEDFSDRRRDLLATRKMLVEVSRTHAEEGVRERAKTLIQNIDLMTRDPNDEAVAVQFRKNYADFVKQFGDLQ